MINLSITSILIITLQKILIFLGGIIIGIILVMFIYLIITCIFKKQQKNIKLSESKATIPNLKELIDNAKMEYLTDYGNKIISLRIQGIKNVGFSLINNIASMYYPKSKLPLYEVSSADLVLLANEVISKVDKLINEIIESKPFKVAWIGYAIAHNTRNFFSKLFRIETIENVKLDIRQMKISYVFEVLDKMNAKQKNEVKSEDKKYFILDSFINNKIIQLINEIGVTADSVYSGKLNNHNLLPEVIK